MPNLPTTEELRKAGEQVAAAARTPLLAALGAGDLAAKAVIDALAKAKERAEAARTAGRDLPTELKDLKEKFDPAELRKIVDAYTQSALNLYQYLAQHGEQALEKIKTQPQVQEALRQVDTATDEVRDAADDVLGKVTRRTREVGEKVADQVDDATEKLAVKVEEVGGDVAQEVRTTTRKAAPRKTTGTARATAKKATDTAE
ncbi:hypothetical protein [Saccharothrix coeruleofusca]|uniref:Membrane protein n=1 Tax=Saccharothrix coeruleofusca TaxID=33919 RepID=A0A918AME1_9PSEU|nr:hypothetical protein [Saccharothrix coeruleofusca]MBP2339574.1 heparin binding hemagglutinin HbhA [Saccharothrix coeruleofusca]GGP56738.1 membrane protein [Saccharothrix coeruleofusca]